MWRKTPYSSCVTPWRGWFLRVDARRLFCTQWAHDAVDAKLAARKALYEEFVEVATSVHDLKKGSFIRTSAKLKILRMVHDDAYDLQDETFVGQSGNASSMIVGEKGIGKSGALISAARAISAMPRFHNVLPVYQEYLGDAPSYPPPSQLLTKALQDRNIEVEGPGIASVVQTLKKHNLFAYVIADEVDNIYTSVHNENERLNVLDQLAYLASNREGRTFTVICSSSSLLPSLITKHIVHLPELRTEYPLTGNAPNLNGSKYTTVRVSQEPSRAEWDTILRGMNWAQSTSADALFFFCGNNLRAIAQLKRMLEDGSTERIIDHFEMTVDLGQKATVTRRTYGALIDALRENLFAANEKILRPICEAPPEKLWDLVCGTPFLDKFEPLYRREIENILNNLNAKQKAEGKLPFVIEHVNSLVDKNWFSAPVHLEKLYPRACTDLLCFSKNAKTHARWGDVLFSMAMTRTESALKSLLRWGTGMDQ